MTSVSQMLNFIGLFIYCLLNGEANAFLVACVAMKCSNLRSKSDSSCVTQLKATFGS